MTKPSDRQPDERLADWVDERMTARERDRFEGEMRVNKELRQQAEAYRRAVEQIRGALQAPMPRLDIADEVLQRVQHPVSKPVFAPRTLRRGPLLASGLAAAALLITAVLIQSLPTKVEPTVTKTADARNPADAPTPDLSEAMSRLAETEAAKDKDKDNEQQKLKLEELNKRSELSAHDDFHLGAPPKTAESKTGEPKFGEQKPGEPKSGEIAAKVLGAGKQDGGADKLEGGAAKPEGAAKREAVDGKQAPVPETSRGQQPPPEGDRAAAGGKEVADKETNKGAGDETRLDRGDLGRLQAAPAPLQQLAVVPTVQAWVLTRHMATVDGAEKSKAAADRTAPAAAPTETWKGRAQAADQSFLSFLTAVPGPAGGEPAAVTQLHYDFSDVELAGIDNDEAAKNARRTTFYRGIEALGLANKDAATVDNGAIRLRDEVAAASADGGTTALFLVEGTQAQVGEVLRVVSGWALGAAAEKRLDEVPATAVDSLSELNERRKSAAVGIQAGGGRGTGGAPAGRAPERGNGDGRKSGEKKDEGKKDLPTVGRPETKSRGGAPKPPASPPADHVRVLIVLRDEVPKKK